LGVAQQIDPTLVAGTGADAVWHQKLVRGEVAPATQHEWIGEQLEAAAVTTLGFQRDLERQLAVALLCGGSAYLSSRQGQRGIGRFSDAYHAGGIPPDNTSFYSVLHSYLEWYGGF
jgi:hypothetical protein